MTIQQIDESTFRCPSASRPGQFHTVHIHAYGDGVLRVSECECEAWLFGKPCRHGRAVLRVAELQAQARRARQLAREMRGQR